MDKGIRSGLSKKAEISASLLANSPAVAESNPQRFHGGALLDSESEPLDSGAFRQEGQQGRSATDKSPLWRSRSERVTDLVGR
jgi:hypothetical protein